jgi:hypothetical protein
MRSEISTLKKIVLLVVGVLIMGPLTAQDTISDLKNDRFFIKWHPFGHLNPARNTAMFSVDKPIGQTKWLVSAGLGYIYSSEFVNGEGESHRGGRVRVGARYRVYKDRGMQNFFGIETKYIYARNSDYRVFTRQGGAFTQSYLIDRQFQQVGLGAIFANYIFLGESKRFFFEPVIGLGVAYYDLKIVSNIPSDAFAEDFGSRTLEISENPGSGFTLDLPITFCIGYRF